MELTKHLNIMTCKGMKSLPNLTSENNEMIFTFLKKVLIIKLSFLCNIEVPIIVQCFACK